MTDINIRELANELSQLKDFKEKYLNIRNFFESKTSEIYEKLSEVEKNNDNLLKEIKSLLSEINPIIKFKPKSAKIKGLEIQHKKRGKVDSYVNNILNFFRENRTEELTISQIEEKFSLCGGATTQKVKHKLLANDEIKSRYDYNNRRKLLISYGANPKTNLPKISEHIVQKDKIGEGIIIEIEEKKELQDSLPKKFSFMK